MATKVISFFSTKGGCGKSTAVKFLSYELSRLGKKVLVIDLDQNGLVPKAFGINNESFFNSGKTVYEWITTSLLDTNDANKIKFTDVVQKVPDENIWFVPSDHKVDKIAKWIEEETIINPHELLKKLIEPIEKSGKMDFIFFDNHPSQNSVQAIMSLIAADLVLIPFLFDEGGPQSAERSSRIIRSLQKQGLSHLQYKIVPMAYDTNSFGEHQKILDTMIAEFSSKGITEFAQTKIKYSKVIPKFAVSQKNIQEYRNNKFANDVLNCYTKLLQEIS